MTAEYSTKPTVAIACGGTGGHVFPGLAIGSELQRRGYAVLVLVSGQHAAEHRAQAAERGFQAVAVPSVRMPSSLLGRAVFAVRLGWCSLDCWRILGKRKCKAVLGMGSFASAPACIGAILCRIPLVLHEGNAVVGRANRMLSRRAAVLACSLPVVNPETVRCPVEQTGLPVRAAIACGASRVPVANEYRSRNLEPGRTTVLVFGGSQGAKALNERVPQAMRRLGKDLPLQVVHLTGSDGVDAVRESYDGAGIPSYVRKREMAMETLYPLADAVVCRAGASTLTELGLLGKSAVLIPLPTAADDHQTANARVFCRSFPARMVPQADATDEALAARIREVLEPSSACGKAAHPVEADSPEVFVPKSDAAARVAALIEQALQVHSRGKHGPPA